jgi:hypothetical protein
MRSRCVRGPLRAGVQGGGGAPTKESRMSERAPKNSPRKPYSTHNFRAATANCPSDVCEKGGQPEVRAVFQQRRHTHFSSGGSERSTLEMSSALPERIVGVRVQRVMSAAFARFAYPEEEEAGEGSRSWSTKTRHQAS